MTLLCKIDTKENWHVKDYEKRVRQYKQEVLSDFFSCVAAGRYLFWLLFDRSFLPIARLDILIHLSHATAKSIKVAIASRCTVTACPAKLIAAQVARHVVTALVFLDLGAAHGAEGDIVFVLFRPALQLVFHCLFTRPALVPLLSALETDVSAALRTGQLLIVCALGSHVLAAALLGTPSHQKIRVDLLLLLEALQLGMKVVHVALDEDKSHPLRRNCLPAFVVKALKFVDFSFFDISLELFNCAFAAEAVRALEFNCF